MFPGYAKSEAMTQFLNARAVHPDQKRSFCGSPVASLGLGTYLGKMDEFTDAQVAQAVVQSVEMGCNLIDTAINYRGQRGERSVGEGIRRAILSGKIQRDQIFVATKGGFVPFDRNPPADMRAYFISTYAEPGICGLGDVVSGVHCLSPKFLKDQVSRSRQNLGLETIDLYYLHNPETQLEELPERLFYIKLEEAFAAMEELVVKGEIRAYGMATWDGFRNESTSQGYLDLQRCYDTAASAYKRVHPEYVGPAKSSFKAVQIPFNLAMPEAILVNTQRFHGHPHSAITTAKDLGLSVAVSAPLYQARLCHGLPEFLVEAFPKELSQAHCALVFASSFPEVDVALVGMKSFDHVQHNLQMLKKPRMSVDQLRAVISAMMESGGAPG
jgi:aryl-alcohol dehydrogenase-like predicted oxidoreductase